MVYQKLGKTDLEISRISFGCMSLNNNQKENEILIHHAIDKGINHFDTADIYDNGFNETSVGKALKKYRHKVTIATKCGNQLNADGNGWKWNASKAYIIEAAEASLQRLQTNYIDLYQLHGGTIEDEIDDTIEAFELLQKQGKIRYYGISSIRPNVIREYVSKSNIGSVMMQYSLLDRRLEESCLPLLYENEIGLLARGTIAGGLLANKPAKEYLNYSTEQVRKATDAIHAISGNHRSAAQTSIQFVLSNPTITSAVVGIHTHVQLNEAVETISTNPLLKEELELLRSVLAPNTYEQHR